jgi:hypothetical protein
MFHILQYTPCKVLKPDGTIHDHTTQKVNFFDKHEVVNEPGFKLGPAIGKLYGFERDGFTLYVHAKYIEYVD